MIARSKVAGRRAYERLELSTRDLAAAAAGVLLLGLSGLFFAALTEDVLHKDGLARHDSSHLQFFIHHRTAQLVQGARWVTDLGAIGVLAVLAVMVAAVLWFRGARLIAALAPGLALAVAGACAAVGKTWVGRARPPLRLHLITETEPSFPSGHTTDASAFFLTLALIVAVVVLRRPLARLVTVLLAALLCAAIGASRLILGVHWPTDVLAGWSLGATIALAVTLLTVLLIRLVPLDDLARRHRFARVLLIARPTNPRIAARP